MRPVRTPNNDIVAALGSGHGVEADHKSDNRRNDETTQGRAKTHETPPMKTIGLPPKFRCLHECNETSGYKLENIDTSLQAKEFNGQPPIPKITCSGVGSSAVANYAASANWFTIVTCDGHRDSL